LVLESAKVGLGSCGEVSWEEVRERVLMEALCKLNRLCDEFPGFDVVSLRLALRAILLDGLLDSNDCLEAHLEASQCHLWIEDIQLDTAREKGACGVGGVSVEDQGRRFNDRLHLCGEVGCYLGT
jgi:hypothetical protein